MIIIVVVLAVLVSSVLGGYGTTWTQTSAPTNVTWYSIASDSTGQYLAATQYDVGNDGAYIYTSSSGGNFWSRTSAPTYSWLSIASDSTGQYLAATQYAGYIFTSTSGGSTWSQTSAPYATWYSIASDSTGQYLAAVNTVGYIYTSTSGGSIWTTTSAPYAVWYSISSDSTGKYLAAIVQGGYIYTTSSGGTTWTQTSAPSGNWWSIASDSTGQYLAAVIDGGYIYTSSSGGSSWTQTSAPSGNWNSIASDSTGQYLAAVQWTGYIYTSSSGGSTWTLTSTPSANWRSIVSNSEGSLLFAGQDNGGLYRSVAFSPTSQPSSAPTNPTGQPSTSPSSQPSSSPSYQPTINPDYEAALFKVTQVITNVSPQVSWDNQCNITLQYTVAQVLLYYHVNPDNVNNIAVSAMSSSLVSSLPHHSVRGLANTAVVVTYTITIYESNGELQDQYFSLKDIMSAAVTSGTFTKDLQTNAVTTSASSLYSATCTMTPTYGSLEGLSQYPTPLPTLEPAKQTSTYCSAVNSIGTLNKFLYYTGFVLAFSAIGLIISFLRQRSKIVIRYSPILIVVEMGILGLDMISDMVYVFALYSSHLFVALASVMLVVRLIHPCTSMYVINSFFGRGRARYYYSKLIDSGNLATNAKPYGLLLLVALVETTAIKFLPWILTEFSALSGGYPDIFMFRLCGYSKIGQSLVSLVIQTVVLVHFSSVSRCSFVLIITFVSTVLVVLVTTFEIVFQVVSVQDIVTRRPSTDSTASRITSSLIDNSGRQSISMTAKVRIEDETVNPVTSDTDMHAAGSRAPRESSITGI